MSVAVTKKRKKTDMKSVRPVVIVRSTAGTSHDAFGDDASVLDDVADSTSGQMSDRSEESPPPSTMITLERKPTEVSHLSDSCLLATPITTPSHSHRSYIRDRSSLWTPISELELKDNPDSVWHSIDEISDGNFDIDRGLFESLFSVSSDRKSGGSSSSSESRKHGRDSTTLSILGKNEPIAFLSEIDTGLSISMNREMNKDNNHNNHGRSDMRVQWDPWTIRKAILEMDESVMDPPMIDRYLKLIPMDTPGKPFLTLLEKHLNMKEYSNEEIDRFGKPELLWFLLYDIPKLHDRLNIWKFKMEFEKKSSEIEQRIKCLSVCYQQIQSSMRLKRVLSCVLFVINSLTYMNSTIISDKAAKVTPQGKGISLDTLSKLNDYKSMDGRTSLLRYVFDEMQKQYPDLIDISKEINTISDVIDVLKIDTQNKQSGLIKLLNEINQFEQSIIDMELKMTEVSRYEMSATTMKKASSSMPTAMMIKDRFLETMNPLAIDARLYIKKIKNELNDFIADSLKLSRDYMESFPVMYGDIDITILSFYHKMNEFLCQWNELVYESRSTSGYGSSSEEFKDEPPSEIAAAVSASASSSSAEATAISSTRPSHFGRSKSDGKRIKTRRKKKLSDSFILVNLAKKKRKIRFEQDNLEVEDPRESSHSLGGTVKKTKLQKVAYKCHHCDEIRTDSIQKSGEYMHRCWVSPAAKSSPSELTGKSRKLMFFSESKKSDHCHFTHDGPCIEMLSEEQQRSFLAAQQAILNSRKTDGRVSGSHHVRGSIRSGGGGSGGSKVASSLSMDDHTYLGSLRLKDRIALKPYEMETQTSVPIMERKKKTAAPVVSSKDKLRSKIRGRQRQRNRSGSAAAAGRVVSSASERKQAKFQGPLGSSDDLRKSKLKRIREERSIDLFGSSFDDTVTIDSVAVELTSADEEDDDTSSVVSSHFAPGSFIAGRRKRRATTAGDEFRSRGAGGARFGRSMLQRSEVDRRLEEIEKVRGWIADDIDVRSTAAMYGSPRDLVSTLTDSPSVIPRISPDISTPSMISSSSSGVLLSQPPAHHLRSKSHAPGRAGSRSHFAGRSHSISHARSLTHGLHYSRFSKIMDEEKRGIHRFLLNDKQLEILMDGKRLSMILSDVNEYGSLEINDDKNELIINCKRFDYLSLMVNQLESRYLDGSILWKTNEIKHLMSEISKKTGEFDGYNITSIIEMSTKQDLKLLRKFLNRINNHLNGTRFMKYNLRYGLTSHHRWFLIRGDRLYWKESVLSETTKSRSLLLYHITDIKQGKKPGLKSVKTYELSDDDESESEDYDNDCYFSIFSDKLEIHLEADTDELAFQWISYLRALISRVKKKPRDLV